MSRATASRSCTNAAASFLRSRAAALSGSRGRRSSANRNTSSNWSITSSNRRSRRHGICCKDSAAPRLERRSRSSIRSRRASLKSSSGTALGPTSPSSSKGACKVVHRCSSRPKLRPTPLLWRRHGRKLRQQTRSHERRLTTSGVSHNCRESTLNNKFEESGNLSLSPEKIIPISVVERSQSDKRACAIRREHLGDHSAFPPAASTASALTRSDVAVVASTTRSAPGPAPNSITSALSSLEGPATSKRADLVHPPRRATAAAPARPPPRRCPQAAPKPARTLGF